jgi:hypothetical protein
MRTNKLTIAKNLDLKPIAPILSKMKIGQSESYSLTKYYSVETTIRRVSKMKQMGFSYKTNNDNNTITVTRTK